MSPTKLELAAESHHINEWLDFVERVGDGRDPKELAVNFWSQFEDIAREATDHPYNIIHYSAGVYLGEVDQIMLPKRAHWVEDVDEVQVAKWLSDPEVYHIAGEDFVREYISFNRVSQEDIDENGLGRHGLMLTHLMERDVPELVEAFCQRHYQLSDVDLRENLIALNMALIMDYV